MLQQLPELDPQTWRVGKTLVFLSSFDVITLLDTLREERTKLEQQRAVLQQARSEAISKASGP